MAEHPEPETLNGIRLGIDPFLDAIAIAGPFTEPRRSIRLISPPVIETEGDED